MSGKRVSFNIEMTDGSVKSKGLYHMANNGKVFAFIEVNEAEYQKDPKNYKFYIHITNQKFKLIKSLLVDEVVNVILITDK